MRGELEDVDSILVGVALRIVQEAIGNAVRHSQAKLITVEAEGNNQCITLSIHDDGTGFDPSSVPSKCLGLHGISKRVEIFSGIVKINSKPGAGTKIDVQLPVQKIIRSESR